MINSVKHLTKGFYSSLLILSFVGILRFICGDLWGGIIDVFLAHCGRCAILDDLPMIIGFYGIACALTSAAHFSILSMEYKRLGRLLNTEWPPRANAASTALITSCLTTSFLSIISLCIATLAANAFETTSLTLPIVNPDQQPIDSESFWESQGVGNKLMESPSTSVESDKLMTMMMPSAGDSSIDDDDDHRNDHHHGIMLAVHDQDVKEIHGSLFHNSA